MPSTITDRLTGLTTSVAVKAPCKAVSTTALTLSGEQTVGGVACVDGDRVLYALSGGSASNGIWVVSTGAWTRAKDFDGTRDVVAGTLVLVGPGPAAVLWQVTTSGTIVPGSTAIEITPIDPSTLLVDAGDVQYDADAAVVAGTLAAWLRNELSVFRFIPASLHAAILAGTSTDDVYTYIDQAIDAAIAIGGPVRITFPTGLYKLDTALGDYAGAEDLIIDLQGSTLDFSGVSLAATGPLLGFVGTYGATAALTSNGTQLAQTISVNSSGFAAGDMVRIYSSTIWDSTRTSTKIGEINFIESIPGGSSVVLVDGLRSTYTTAATATMQKLTPIRDVHIRNGKIVGPSGNDQLVGLRLRLGLDCSIENVHTRDIDRAHIRLMDCVQSHVFGCTVEEAYEASEAYGISFMDACQNCSAVMNKGRYIRHFFTTNNTTGSSYGITRDIDVSHNQVFNNVADIGGGVTGDAIDTHAGADGVHIHDNIIRGAFGAGINFEARSGSIRGNTISGTTGNGILYWPYADTEGYCDITGNQLEFIGDDTATNDYGIVCLVVAAAISRLKVNDNTVIAKSPSIRIVGTSGAKVKRLACNGNTAELRVTETLTSAGTFALDIQHVNRGTVNGNIVLDTLYGIYLRDCTHLAIVGNSVEIVGTSGSNGFGIRVETGDYLNIGDNNIYYSTSGIVTTVAISFQGTGSVTNSDVRCNKTRGFGTIVSLGGGSGSVESLNT